MHAGYKCNMTDIQAAIGLVELNRYKETLEKREHIFRLYDTLFRDEKWAILPTYMSTDCTSSFHLYMLRIKNSKLEQRNTIIEKMAERGIAVNVHYKPLPLLTLYKSLNFNIDNYPQALENYTHQISLPVYYNLTDDQVKFVAKNLNEVVEEVLS